MHTSEVLLDSFSRVKEGVGQVLDGLGDEDLVFRADSRANSISWLIWHLTRVQDDHVAEVAGKEQVWLSDGWALRFGLELDNWDIGYGHKSSDVALVRAGAAQLSGYHEAVFDQTTRYVKGLRDEDLDRVVDTRWDPPVTLGVRLISVIADDLQHVGQAAFVRGLVERRRPVA